jgi:uncharacterized small protein (DUF1192 family)|tara:strand:- start:153 stop:305 length:153 start_codon:yes stop_codon:yes gene_type:complete
MDITIEELLKFYGEAQIENKILRAEIERLQAELNGKVTELPKAQVAEANS